MLPAFMVSAPGKVIVFGEHAVVHGKVSKRRLRGGGEGERDSGALTLWTTGCDSCCHLVAVISPRHNTVQI
jgi:hypothetical protein